MFASILAILAAAAFGFFLLFGYTPKAQAQEVVDTSTVSAVDAIETAAATTSVDAITPAEVKSGTVCEVTLPADTGVYDRVKSKFAQLGCELKVYTHSDGNSTVEVGEAKSTDVPSTK